MIAFTRTAAAVGALLALSLAAPHTVQPAMAAEPVVPVLYGGATVIDGTGAGARANQDILVQGDRILAIGPHGSLPAEEVAGARKVDLSGRWVIPGLIDTHVHMATPPNPKRAQGQLRRLLYGGVTSVRDMADDLRSVSELARAALVGEIPAPDIYSAAVMAGPPFFGVPVSARSAWDTRPAPRPGHNRSTPGPRSPPRSPWRAAPAPPRSRSTPTFPPIASPRSPPRHTGRA
ncbi:hypothetical protein [Novosphingobium sp. ST904]|uniref:amidohydrolase family protein n=1 Tax=Novosphingobium sp. ST904 TaxID=1684385 RepID=UPI000A913CC3